MTACLRVIPRVKHVRPDGRQAVPGHQDQLDVPQMGESPGFHPRDLVDPEAEFPQVPQPLPGVGHDGGQPVQSQVQGVEVT